MTSPHVLTIVALALLGAQQAPPRDTSPQVSRTSALSGIVTDDVGAPVRRAQVTLVNGSGTVRLAGTADDLGRFAFGDLPSGEFLVSASLPGYSASVPEPGKPGPVASLRLADAQRTTDLRLALERAAAISGRIVDEDGQGIAGLQVRASRLSKPLGGTDNVPVIAGSAFSDRDGRYRIGGLRAGDYVIRSSRPGTGNALGRSDTQGRERVVMFLETFHSDAVRMIDATVVKVRAGDVRTGVDVVLRPVAASELRGIGRLPDGSTPTVVSVEVRESGSREVRYRSAAGGTQGRFLVAAVPPGQYDSVARAVVGGPTGPGGRAGAVPPNYFFGTARVVTSGSDPDEVTINLEPAARVRATLLFVSASLAPPSNSTVTLTAIPGPSLAAASTSASATLAADGTGTALLAMVAPGQYVFATSSFPRGWSLKSATMGDRDVTDIPIDFAAGADFSNVTLTLTDRLTELTCSVRDSANQPLSSATVVVFARDSKYWFPGSRRVQEMRRTADGTLVATGLPAGEYSVAAIGAATEAPWQDPASLNRLAQTAVRVVLSDGEKRSVSLQVR